MGFGDASLTPRLPRNARHGIIEVSKLDEAQFGALVDAISKLPPAMYPNEKSWWPKDVDGVPRASLEEIVDSVLILRWIASDKGDLLSDSSLGDILDQVASDENLQPEIADIVKSRTLALASIPSIVISSRAFFLALSNPNSLVNSRIITDIRMVFKDGTSTDLCGAVILHNLKMSFASHNGDADDMSVTMDSRDLQKLIEQLQRAQQKSEVLAKMLSQTNVPLIPANATRTSR